MNNKIIKILLVTVIVSLSSRANAGFFLKHWEDHRQPYESVLLNPSVGGYQSQINFDHFGSKFKPSTLVNYQRINSDVLLSWGLSRKLSLFGRASWSFIQVESKTTNARRFGFTDQTLGMTVRFLEWKSGGAIDLQGQVDIPTYNNAASASDKTPYLGDGSLDFTGGAFLDVPLANWKTSRMKAILGAGFTWRTLNFSQSVPWIIEIKHEPKVKGLIMEASALGLQSLQTDGSYGVGFPELRTNSNSANSFFTAPINPNLLTLRGKIGYKLATHMGITASFEQSVWGSSAPHGTSVWVGFNALWGPLPDGASVKLTPDEYGRSNKGFVPYGVEAHVTKANDRLNLVKIDKGTADGVVKGDTFDVFSVDEGGKLSETIARAKVISVKSSEAALKIEEYYKEVWIEEGFIVKRPIK